MLHGLRRWLAARFLRRPQDAARVAAEDALLRIPDGHPPLDDTPDQPPEFGLKTCWLAVRTAAPERVLALLKAQDVRRANWQSGIDMAYWAQHGQDREAIGVVFVSPPVQGWVFVVGMPPPEAAHAPTTRRFEALLAPLVAGFPEVQAFASHRGVDYVAWARAVDGQWLRRFAYADGAIMRNEGAQTAEERQLGLIELHGPAFAEGEFAAWLDCGGSEECMPLQLAGRWSINPAALPGMGVAPGVGRVGRLF